MGARGEVSKAIAEKEMGLEVVPGKGFLFGRWGGGIRRKLVVAGYRRRAGGGEKKINFKRGWKGEGPQGIVRCAGSSRRGTGKRKHDGVARTETGGRGRTDGEEFGLKRRGCRVEFWGC